MMCLSRFNLQPGKQKKRSGCWTKVATGTIFLFSRVTATCTGLPEEWKQANLVLAIRQWELEDLKFEIEDLRLNFTSDLNLNFVWFLCFVIWFFFSDFGFQASDLVFASAMALRFYSCYFHQYIAIY